MGAAGTPRRANSQVKGGGGDSGVARGRGKGPPGKGGWDDAERDGKIRAEYHGLF